MGRGGRSAAPGRGNVPNGGGGGTYIIVAGRTVAMGPIAGCPFPSAAALEEAPVAPGSGVAAALLASRCRSRRRSISSGPSPVGAVTAEHVNESSVLMLIDEVIVSEKKSSCC